MEKFKLWTTKDLSKMPPWAVFTTLFVLLFFTGRIVPAVAGVNEWDVLAVARHFMNQSWIPKDWYLNQPIGYRYFFNIVIGGLFRIFPFPVGIFLGRILMHLCLTWAFTRLVQVTKINTGVIVWALFLYFTSQVPQSLCAGEWFTRALESKVFAYAFWIISMTYLLEKRYVAFWIFAGISASFHVLVGGYGLLSCGMFFIIDRVASRDFSDIKALLRKSWIFLLSGALGIWSILSFFFLSGDGTSVRAAQIYTWRVGHHVNPLMPNGVFRESKFLLCIGAVTGLALVFVFFKKIMPNKRLQSLALICLLSSLFLFLGMGVAMSGNAGLMKLYLFRFPDVMIPFFLTILVLQAVYSLLIRGLEYFQKPMAASYLTILLIASMCIVLVYQNRISSVVHDLRRLEDTELSIRQKKNQRTQLYTWIKKNTAEDSVFLVNPGHLFDFYINANRARVVSAKHMPQTAPEIIEWYKRLTFGNNGIEPDLNKKFRRRTGIRDKHFSKISKRVLLKQKTRFGYDYYLSFEKRKDLKEWEVFKNNKFYVYKVP